MKKLFKNETIPLFKSNDAIGDPISFERTMISSFNFRQVRSLLLEILISSVLTCLIYFKEINIGLKFNMMIKLF